MPSAANRAPSAWGSAPFQAWAQSVTIGAVMARGELDFMVTLLRMAADRLSRSLDVITTAHARVKNTSETL
ncbi:hypothetical protein GCM10010442_18650 [Kitasatospora kifunensis]